MKKLKKCGGIRFKGITEKKKKKKEKKKGALSGIRTRAHHKCSTLHCTMLPRKHFVRNEYPENYGSHHV